MSVCPGCGLDRPAVDGPTHAYLAASSACWARFGEALALHYADRAYWPAHQLLTDAYSLQHSIGDNVRSRRSALIHLVALGAGLDGAAEARLVWLRSHVPGAADPPKLEPPECYSMTIISVTSDDPEGHLADTGIFARAVWDAWGAHHALARHLAEEAA